MNAEKLAELRLEGHESECLDFKAMLNLDDRRDVVEFAKDVGAMQVRGGFIVVGAADDGSLTGMLDERMATLLDEATVRNKLRRYIPEPFEIRVAVHEIDGRRAAVIYVAPHPLGFCVFAADGTRPDGRAVFRAGEVFARHGTASERWRQEDIPAIIGSAVSREKEVWRAEVAGVVAAQVAGGLAHQQLARGPVEAVSWHLDEASYAGAITEMLRSGDTAGRRAAEVALLRGVRELLINPERVDELSTALDRAAAMAATAVAIGSREDVDQAAAFLVRLYNLGDDDGLRGGENARLWFELVLRVLAIGATAVRLERWELLPQLVLRVGSHRSFGRFRDWLTHATYAAGEAGLMTEVLDGRRTNTPLLRSAAAWASSTTITRPDLPADVTQERVADLLLASLCQFDFLAYVLCAHAAGPTGGTRFYPDFGRFYSHRTSPIVERLLRDPQLREVVYPGTDADLAATLIAINTNAIAVSRHAGWDGFASDAVERFINQNRPAD